MNVWRRFAAGLVFGGVALLASCGDDGKKTPGQADAVVLSSRSDMVSDGSALVQVTYPRDYSSAPKITLNGADVSPSFKPDGAGNLVGLVTGMRVGTNTLLVGGNDLNDRTLTLRNYPVTGPIFSGPQEQPFYCQTTTFRLPGSTATLGAPLDANCSVATRVDYVYRSSDGTFKLLPSGSTRPIDLVTTTTSLGKTVPYVVRVETGSINRGIYQTAVLSDPSTESNPSPFARPAAWNQRLVYGFGGGCTGGWYIQGGTLGNTNANSGVLEDLMLKQGYAVVGSTLNVFGNNCNDVTAAETAMMVKERFIKTYGAPLFTVGYGCSGGSEALHPLSDEYPGIVDGIIVGCSFPEVTVGMILNFTDADLFNRYITTAGASWTVAQQTAVTGYPNTTTVPNLAAFAARVKAQGGTCNALVPVNTRYDRLTNPNGVRCDIYDHFVNVYGRDPVTKFARRPLDNVGVQYGLLALNSGAISKAQFLDLNAKIGGYDNDGVYVATRTVADEQALSAMYRTGRVTYGGLGMKTLPIIDYRSYADVPENSDEVHSRFHSFSMRARLQRANGTADNQVMLVEEKRPNIFDDASPVLSHALTQMDQWLSSLRSAAVGATPTIAQLNATKPADLVDACFSNGGTVKIVETQVYTGNTRCNQLYPSYSTPRMQAGGPLTNDIAKCTLKPLSPSDYGVTFTSDEMAQLQAIFPSGVCNFAVPGVAQVPTQGTWQTF